MNNDIVVKQKPAAGAQPADTGLAVKQAPQAAEPTTPEEPAPASPDAPAEAVAPVSEKSNKPVGIIIAAIFVALCLATVAIYIGYNQSQTI